MAHSTHFKRKEMMTLEAKLSMLLKSIAKDLKIKNKDKWVKDRLANCQIAVFNPCSKYNKEIHLLSRKDIPFGVVDNFFNTAEFVLFISQNIPEDKLTEYQVYTFNDVDNEIFIGYLKDVLQLHLDNLTAFKLYFKWKPVDLKLINDSGTWKIGDDIGEWDKNFELVFDFYEIVLVNRSGKEITVDVPYRSWHKESIEDWLLKYNDLIIDNKDAFIDCGEETWISDTVLVKRNGEYLPYRLIRLGEKYLIEWVVQDRKEQNDN